MVSFDGDGNPLTWNGSSLSFTAEDRLTHFGSVQTDQYDAFGLRAVKATTVTHPEDAGTTYYLYDGDTQVAAANLNGKVLWVNAFGETGLLGEYADGGYHLFYTFDTTGNIAQRWNNTAFDSAYGFDGYGQPLAGTVGATYGNYDPHTGYSSQGGGYYDYDTNLVLMGHRYYDPSSGRFLNRDPSGYGGGINLYSYTQNNPVNHRDPLGLDAGGAGAIGDDYQGHGYSTPETHAMNIKRYGIYGDAENGQSWNIFWDWISEKGPTWRAYGPKDLGTQDMAKSIAADRMRWAFAHGQPQGYEKSTNGFVDSFVDDPSNNTADYVGGFHWTSQKCGSNVTFRIYNELSIYSFFYHVGPHKPRGGSFPFMGNIQQKFYWTEPIAKAKSTKEPDETFTGLP